MRFTNVVTPHKPRPFSAVQKMYTAPHDRRWLGVKKSVKLISTARVVEAQQELR